MKISLILVPVLAIWTVCSALAQGEVVAPVPCTTPEDMLASSVALSRVGTRIADAAPITIVTLGSSSTFGSGASTPGASYPSQLEELLHQSLPRSDIHVFNKGIPGERNSDMLARFGRDVVDLQPDLLIWQTGTNSALRHVDLSRFTDELNRGIVMAHAARIDLVLLTPQFSPAFLAVPNYSEYLGKIATVATDRRVAVFRRFEAMRHWQEVGRVPANTLTGPDGLHMTDLGYTCLARALARMIVKLARPVDNNLSPSQTVGLPGKSRP